MVCNNLMGQTGPVRASSKIQANSLLSQGAGERETLNAGYIPQGMPHQHCWIKPGQALLSIDCTQHSCPGLVKERTF